MKEELAAEEEVLTHEREVGSPWVFAKDGKARFDPDESPAGMRK